MSDGNVPTGSVDVVPAEAAIVALADVDDFGAEDDDFGEPLEDDEGAAVTDTVAAATGSVLTLVAAAAAVSFTDVTDLAEDATAICAWS